MNDCDDSAVAKCDGTRIIRHSARRGDRMDDKRAQFRYAMRRVGMVIMVVSSNPQFLKERNPEEVSFDLSELGKHMPSH